MFFFMFDGNIMTQLHLQKVFIYRLLFFNFDGIAYYPEMLSDPSSIHTQV